MEGGRSVREVLLQHSRVLARLKGQDMYGWIVSLFGPTTGIPHNCDT